MFKNGSKICTAQNIIETKLFSYLQNYTNLEEVLKALEKECWVAEFNFYLKSVGEDPTNYLFPGAPDHKQASKAADRAISVWFTHTDEGITLNTQVRLNSNFKGI